MSFEKQYPNHKDHRKPHRGAMAVDATCRPHGSCPYCAGNRMHVTRKRIAATHGDDGQAGLSLRRPEAFYTLAEIEPSPDGRNRTAKRVVM